MRGRFMNQIIAKCLLWHVPALRRGILAENALDVVLPAVHVYIYVAVWWWSKCPQGESVNTPVRETNQQ